MHTEPCDCQQERKSCQSRMAVWSSLGPTLSWTGPMQAVKLTGPRRQKSLRFPVRCREPALKIKRET
ncbi:hypothetical protein V1264_009018 [Littorina saxatilis]|uniref:Uncharacterized protein n=1 Tax=Littorina saxatilis TaxID=31220 RepID=A0AAN9G0X0_9CAEN